MVRDIEGIVAKAGGAVSDLAEVASELQLAARNIKTLSQSINARDNGVPRLLQRADTTLATLQQSMRDLALAAQRAPQIVHNVELGSQDIPSLLTQTSVSGRLEVRWSITGGTDNEILALPGQRAAARRCRCRHGAGLERR